MKKKLVLMTVLLVGLGFILASCVTVPVKPTAANFKDPVINLDSIQLGYYEGFWYYGKAKVAMGKAPKGGGGSPVGLNFVFEITNPNKYPILLESAQFFLYFDDYELRIVRDNNPMWIPAEKTNSKMMSVTLTPFSTYAKFLLAGKQKAMDRGDKPWDKVKQWWTGLPDMSFKIDVKEASFVFSADGVSKALNFETRYP